MRDNFDLHKWKEYQLFLNEQDGFELGSNDYELAKGFNIKELKEGDIIKPEMVDVSNIPENNLYWYEKEIIASQVGKIWKVDKKYVELQYKRTDEGHSYIILYTIDFLEILKPEYNLVLPDGTILEKQDLNEQDEFSLGDNDLELAKDFQNQNITKGSKINANMFKNPDIIYRYIGDGNFIVKKIYQEDKNSIPVWKINLAEEDNPRSIFKMDLDDVQKMLLNGHKILLPKPKLKEEEFSLGDEDLELAKGFNVKYLTKDSTITPDMWDQNKIKNIYYTDLNFNKSYKITDFVDESWDDDGEYYTDVFLVDSDGEDLYEILDNINLWLKPEFQVEESLNEDFELTDDDLELAKGFQDFNFEVIVHSDYTVFNIETDEQDTVTKITKCTLNSSELEQELGISIPYNSGAIGDILYESLWDNDWLTDKLMEGDTVIQELPDFFFDDDWDNEWDDLQLEVKILDKVNESFELTDDDLEMAKDFNPNIIYLGKGDTIDAGVINSRASYYIVGFEGNSVLLKKDNSEYVSKFYINMVQNKMEDGYILDPYK